MKIQVVQSRSGNIFLHLEGQHLEDDALAPFGWVVAAVVDVDFLPPRLSEYEFEAKLDALNTRVENAKRSKILAEMNLDLSSLHDEISELKDRIAAATLTTANSEHEPF